MIRSLLAGALGCVAVLPVAVVAWAEPVSGVHQAPPPTSRVTFAARTCDEYTDIMANRARNNIQQSLRDLGKDSVYRSGQPVDPAIEGPNNPACRPLVGWQFTLGSGFDGRVGGLTTVSGADAPTPATGASVPLLDRYGQPTGGSLAGAVTVTLTAAQLDRASRGRLTMQGGTPVEPLLGGWVPDGGAFGTIRCATDNNNADNVEYVDFPTGFRHVFCFGYYIDTRVPEGTIVVRKQFTGGTNTETFGFGGNVSYATGGAFALKVDGGRPAEIRFTRAATRADDPPWRITEDPRADWTLQSLTCTAPGGSTATVTGGQVDIRLVAADTVTCVYTNRPPTVAGLVLRKTSTQTTGTFQLDLSGPAARTVTLTTQRPDTPVSAAPLTGLPAGTYTLTETVPGMLDPLGPWHLDGVECNGVAMPVTDNKATITVAANADVDCHVRDSYKLVGSLTVNLVTHGGTGTAAFNVTDQDTVDPALTDNRRVVTAATTAEGSPVRASGDSLDPLITTDAYRIDVNPPASTTGRWVREGVTCQPYKAVTGVDDTGIATVFPWPTLHVECTFIYRLLPPGTLQIVKLAQGPAELRTGPAVITVDCANGAGGQIVLPAGSPGPEQLPEPIQAIDPTQCQITETATGAATGTGHTLITDPTDYRTVAIDNTPRTVTLRNVYGPQIPTTGTNAGRLAAAGAALLLLGAALLALTRQRISRSNG